MDHPPTSKKSSMKRKLKDSNPAEEGNTTAPVVLPESTAYWSKDPYAWSTSLDFTPPLLTSSHCAQALHGLFHNTYYDENADPAIPNFLLSVVVESSSHPSGLNSLFAQPYLYAGPGLGNMDECPLQICLAGGRQTDSFTFASLCIVPECSAYDLASEDFISVANLQLNSFAETTPEDTVDLGQDYVAIIDRMSVINQFLGTGWTCGNFVVPWSPTTAFPVVVAFLACGMLSWWGTVRRTSRRQTDESLSLHQYTVANGSSDRRSVFWNAWNINEHMRHLIKPSSIPCLDGLRVGSMFWIILGHVMAIQSSMGAGYANPNNFLPPSGWTTTVIGQLLFSSRLAVDTFFVISGFLIVLVLYRKLPLPTSPEHQSTFGRYFRYIPFLLAGRVARIVPLYAMMLGFYTQIAPHLGDGPFWHQWLGLLQPCHDAVWTNLLFVNNFLPPNTPTIQTCFYHSWYLAVDMQLFCCAPILILLFQTNPRKAKQITHLLFWTSVLATTYLARREAWSVNTFDGAAVDRYSVEAYAKPHIRMQSYLVGMYVGMRYILDQESNGRRSGRPMHVWHHILLVACLLAMALVTFGTVTGAYARRPCTYKEEPLTNDCGSQWSATTTWLYTSFSRTIWCVALGILIELCVDRQHVLNTILSLPCWAILSHLTFGAYLIHPIVMFVWQIGDREKQIFRLSTFCMDYLSACVVSYVAAFIAAVTIEMPFAALWKSLMQHQSSYTNGTSSTRTGNETDRQSINHPDAGDQPTASGYGSINGKTQQ